MGITDIGDDLGLVAHAILPPVDAPASQRRVLKEENAKETQGYGSAKVFVQHVDVSISVALPGLGYFSVSAYPIKDQLAWRAADGHKRHHQQAPGSGVPGLYTEYMLEPVIAMSVRKSEAFMDKFSVSLSHLKSILLYPLSANPFSDTYSLIYRCMSYHAKFSAFKALFLSALQTVTGFHTYSVYRPYSASCHGCRHDRHHSPPVRRWHRSTPSVSVRTQTRES
jgi:hypothetical protein